MRLLILTLFLFGCASSQTSSEPGDDASRLPADATPQQRYAWQFDRLLSGAITPDEEKALFESCKGKSENPFCPTLKQKKKLLSRIRAAKAEETPSMPVVKPPVLVPPVYVNGKLTNWKKLRRAKVRSLLKGFAELSLEQLRDLSKRAQKESHCPNSVAAAVAATLEDYLPDRVTRDEIATLYEKGAKCLARWDDDRDHFLTRAGLFSYWKKDYKTAAALLAKVPSQDAFLGRHLFYLAKSKLLLGDSAGAEKAWRKLEKMHPFSFHAMAARLARGEDPGKEWLKDGETPQPRSKRVTRANDFIEQVELLKASNYARSATLVAAWTLDDFSKLEGQTKMYLLSLSDPKLRVEWAGAILIRSPSLLSRQSLELNFPLYQLNLFERYDNGLDPYLLLALARKESKFDANAISPANAQGLLQLLPETAKQVDGGNPDLKDPATNIRIGANYLRRLVDKADGRVPHAIAAYNAGEDAVAKWKARYLTDDPLLFLDLIPYRETREYVGFVLTNYYWYSRIHKPGMTVAVWTDIVSSEVARK
jgi:soluble lytic murein transglycosylase